MHLDELPNYQHLTEEEKRRLHKLHHGRVEHDYNVAGEASISPIELRMANDPDLEQVEREAL